MKSPKTLTAEERKLILEYLTPDTGTYLQRLRSLRDQSIALLLFDTGLRVAELCRLEVSDLWFMDGPVQTLVVRPEIAKNHKERTIPLALKVQYQIRAMHESIWKYAPTPAPCYAFYARDAFKPLTTRQVERIVLHAARKAIGRRVTPHMLRHTFATRIMRRSPIRVVQTLLGHSSLTSTQIYTHPDADDLRTAIDNMSLEGTDPCIG